MRQILGCQSVRIRARAVGVLFALGIATIAPAQAHHVMDGRTPASLVEGLLSGLGHPVIGIDHLAFIVAVGLVTGIAALNVAIPALFVAASALGVALHVGGVALPAAELVVAVTVLLGGAMIAAGDATTWRERSWAWPALFAVAGLFHGYAYGESIYGAEPTPLAGYLLGLVLIQSALATAAGLLARRSVEAALRVRLAGAVIAGVGLAVLAGHVVPA
jgi:urease accessory protein